MRVRGTVWNTIKGGGKGEGRESKDFKKGRGQAGSRGGCLKKGGGLEPPYELCFCFILNLEFGHGVSSHKKRIQHF